MRTNQLKASLAALVGIHFVVASVHGIVHDRAHVALTPVALAFVIVVIQLGPLVGLAVTFVRPRIGAAVVAATMAGALLFGVINHFVLPGPDRVGEVDAQWRMLFGSTAALIALLEAAGTAVGAVGFWRDVPKPERSAR